MVDINHYRVPSSSMGDYHVHLHDHGPYTGVGPPLGEYPDGYIEQYVQQARLCGVAEVGFTEHLYRCVESESVLGRFWEHEPRQDLAELTAALIEEDRTLSLENYVTAVVDAKDRGLPVKLGLEVDFFPETIGAVAEFLEPYPWDFLIGAVHWIGGWSVDHGPSSYEVARRGVRQTYEDYFAVEEQLAASGAVDVLAHVDVVKVHGDVPDRPPLDLYAEVVAAAATSETAVEVSSAGIYKPIGEMYPAPPFLRMFHAAGIPITLASDAHKPADCARGIDAVVAEAQAAGYTEHLIFEERKASTAELPILGESVS